MSDAYLIMRDAYLIVEEGYLIVGGFLLRGLWGCEGRGIQGHP